MSDNKVVMFQSAVAHELISNVIRICVASSEEKVSKRCRA